jgi:hypothetical protein
MLSEEEWLACADPLQLIDGHPTPLDERKLLLWACACCRQVWDVLASQRQKAVLVTERYADNLASQGELIASWDASKSSLWDAWLFSIQPPSIARCVTFAAHTAALHAWCRAWGHPDTKPAARSRIQQQEADLFRHIIGDPFHPRRIQPDWLTWQGGTVLHLARVLANEGRNHEFPILGDALEDAGCTDSVILDHCRQGGHHPRGCWLLDQLTGRA